jgi:hypothetical protein
MPAMASLSSGEVKAMAAVAEMPNVASRLLGWLREEVEEVGEVTAVLRVVRFGWRCDNDSAVARRVRGDASALLLHLDEHNRGRRR